MAAAALAPAVGRPPHQPVWASVVGSTASFVALLIVFALALRMLDEVPGLVTGLARGVMRVESLSELERQASRPMPIPAYFPDTLSWPPETLLSFDGSSTSMWFRHRQSLATWLIVATRAGTGDVAPQVLPSTAPLQTESTTVRHLPATVERLIDRDGVVWHQLRWHEAGTTRLVRYRGTLDDAMLIANSIDERGR